jgi:hypothetical protein
MDCAAVATPALTAWLNSLKFVMIGAFNRKRLPKKIPTACLISCSVLAACRHMIWLYIR